MYETCLVVTSGASKDWVTAVSLVLIAEEQVTFPSSLYPLYKMARRKFLSLSEIEELVNDPNFQSNLLESDDDEKACTDIVELPPESVDVVSDREKLTKMTWVNNIVGEPHIWNVKVWDTDF